MANLYRSAGRRKGDGDREGCRDTHIGAGALGSISHALRGDGHAGGRGYGRRCRVKAGRRDRAQG